MPGEEGLDPKVACLATHFLLSIAIVVSLDSTENGATPTGKNEQTRNYELVHEKLGDVSRRWPGNKRTSTYKLLYKECAKRANVVIRALHTRTDTTAATQVLRTQRDQHLIDGVAPRGCCANSKSFSRVPTPCSSAQLT